MHLWEHTYLCLNSLRNLHQLFALKSLPSINLKWKNNIIIQEFQNISKFVYLRVVRYLFYLKNLFLTFYFRSYWIMDFSLKYYITFLIFYKVTFYFIFQHQLQVRNLFNEILEERLYFAVHLSINSNQDYWKISNLPAIISLNKSYIANITKLF